MNNPPSIPKNLHPIWYRHFGIQPQASSQPRPPTALPSGKSSCPVSAPPCTGQAYGTWEPTCSHRPPAGAPVGIRRQLGPHTWEHTVVLPGDSRYPWPDHDSTH